MDIGFKLKTKKVQYIDPIFHYSSYLRRALADSYIKMKESYKYGLYILTFFLTLGLSAYITLLIIVKTPPEVTVPDLTGKDAVTALKILSDIGLNLKVKAVDYSDAVPKDHIISQDPPPGSRLKKKREVKIVLSKGNAAVSLPDLRGLSLGQAESILRQNRLAAGDISYTYGSGPEQGRDRVIAQHPAAFENVDAGASVSLLLSLGPRPEYIIMPDLTGQLYSAALLTLERAELSLGSLETKHLASWPMETVVIQEPGPGSRTVKGALVKLTINRAKDLPPANYEFAILEYNVPYGLFHREIKFRVALGSYLWDIHDAWYKPGERIWLPVPAQGDVRGRIYEDGDEVSALSRNPEIDYGFGFSFSVKEFVK